MGAREFHYDGGMKRLLHWALVLAVYPILSCSPRNDLVTDTPNLWDLSPGLRTRSISFESPTGGKGEGGRAASPLGVGRKGAPVRVLQVGEEVELCDIEGSGTIRHLWMTTYDRPEIFRGAVVRAYWEGQEHPSIEAPLGDFAGFAHGKVTAYQSTAHSVGSRAAMNVWLPMPFTQRARLTLTNESGAEMPLFYQVDYTLDDDHPPDVGRLHVAFRRENPTTEGVDFEILSQRHGKGRFVGAVIGIRSLGPNWWGEGEVKFYLDGDEEFATLVGTGSEDYVGLSFGIQETPFLYHGASLVRGDYVSMYRWHIPDPVYWESAVRVTMQQIGHDPQAPGEYLERLFERSDDWSAAAFWYESVPSAPLSPLISADERLADLWQEEEEEED
jgi:hypothetical protein